MDVDLEDELVGYLQDLPGVPRPELVRRLTAAVNVAVAVELSNRQLTTALTKVQTRCTELLVQSRRLQYAREMVVGEYTIERMENHCDYWAVENTLGTLDQCFDTLRSLGEDVQ